jgi:hypothetical protein
MGCSYCNHPRRVAIDGDLFVGVSLRTIIYFYGGSLAVLHRHSKHFQQEPYRIPEVIAPEPSLFD